jgi:hypothetical protein
LLHFVEPLGGGRNLCPMPKPTRSRLCRFKVGPFFYHTDLAFFLHLRGGRRLQRKLQMSAYKVYVLRDDSHVISEVNLFCDGGAEKAKEIAKRLVDENPVELWDGSTRIARFEPWHGPHANRSAPAGVKRT